MTPLRNPAVLNDLMHSMLAESRIPGAAIAIVLDGETIYAQGFGYRDLAQRLPTTADTVYPIASTSKPINATLLGQLVDEGALGWDVPVREYLPRFRLSDASIGASVTVRDLIAMRTGLPAHELMWVEHPITRAELVERLVHLPFSAGLRERFQYSDLTPSVAGHIAEVVTGQSWENLVQRRILEPLEMNATSFAVPTQREVTLAYHETRRRELVTTPAVIAPLIAPAGGSMHSTVRDMAHWVSANLGGGSFKGRQLITSTALRHIHTPCIFTGGDPTEPSPDAGYALGWFVDHCNGYARICHTGHLYDVNSCVSLYPEAGIGMVCFINFASARLARLINHHAFAALMGLKPPQTFAEALAVYERKIEGVQRRLAAEHRVSGTKPSHTLDNYEGCYENAAYGRMEIRLQGSTLVLKRGDLQLPLEHWHYDVWVPADNDLFEIHKWHAFDRASCILFDTDIRGEIAGLAIQIEPKVSPVRFEKRV